MGSARAELLEAFLQQAAAVIYALEFMVQLVVVRVKVGVGKYFLFSLLKQIV